MSQCVKMTDAELYEFISGGGTVSSGPYDTAELCLAGCSGSDPTTNSCCDPSPASICLRVHFTSDQWVTCLGSMADMIPCVWTVTPDGFAGYYFNHISLNGYWRVEGWLFCDVQHVRGWQAIVQHWMRCPQSPCCDGGVGEAAIWTLNGTEDQSKSISDVCSPFHVFIGTTAQGLEFTDIDDCAGGGGNDISRAILSGTEGTMGFPNLHSVTLEGDALLIVPLGIFGTGTPTATYNGNAMDVTSEAAGGGVITAIASYKNPTASPITGDIIVSGISGTGISFAIEVTGLTNRTADVSAQDSGTGADPSTGATGTTAIADEYVQCVFFTKNPTAMPVAFTNSFAAGQQNGLSASGSAYWLAEGYRVLTATGTANGALTGVSVDSYSGITKAFK